MAYVSIPTDLNRVKSKVLLNLTKRQLICFSCGALVGLPLFLLCREPLGNSSAAMVMMIAMLPAFLMAMYEKNGQPLEVVLRNIIRVCFLRPKQRPYKTNNFYAVLERQDQLDREVYSIVHGAKRNASRKTQTPHKAVPRTEKGNPGGHRKGEQDR